jgi:hypothetical protein
VVIITIMDASDNTVFFKRKGGGQQFNLASRTLMDVSQRSHSPLSAISISDCLYGSIRIGDFLSDFRVSTLRNLVRN